MLFLNSSTVCPFTSELLALIFPKFIKIDVVFLSATLAGMRILGASMSASILMTYEDVSIEDLIDEQRCSLTWDVSSSFVIWSKAASSICLMEAAMASGTTLFEKKETVSISVSSPRIPLTRFLHPETIVDEVKRSGLRLEVEIHAWLVQWLRLEE